MAVRLQMKLGVVAEAERLEDSPDTVAVVEPTIGATSRSKGSLYVVVSGVGRARRLQEATRLVADTVQGEYYYDESAGLVACLEKAIRTANRKLAASREHLGVGGEGGGSIGLGVAVVRGSELYVTTAGPVEAYLVRQAHLLTLPDPNAGVGLPADELAPHVWRGEIGAGDTLVLVSRNVTAILGTDDLKDALNTLHPQAAMERAHGRFRAPGGTGSDGASARHAV
jgi:serine/threonine protein phosphatase PrpC